MNCPYDGANCKEIETGYECEHCHREFQQNEAQAEPAESA